MILPSEYTTLAEPAFKDKLPLLQLATYCLRFVFSWSVPVPHINNITAGINVPFLYLYPY